MSVSVLIVNFRTPELTIEAVESALADPLATEIIAVENGSGDDSAAILADRFRDERRVQIIVSEDNLGFGRGNNLAADASTGEYLFLLNSDATLEDGCLKALLDERTALGTAAIVAPMVHDATTGAIQADAIGPFPTAWRILRQTSKNYGDSLTPDWVSGCAFLIDRTLFRTIGGFDPAIFMYFEDVLLCWQARQNRAPIVRCPQASVRHRGGQSYQNKRTLKKDYYVAQDLFLQRIAEPAPLRWAVRISRAMMIRLGSR